MADGLPPQPGAPPDDPPAPQEPPPLDAIRVKGRGAKGLNKPAILIAAGTGVGLVLILASGALSSDPKRQPADTKPMMSDPARPEIAQGAVRTLPADYAQAAKQQVGREPALPPMLGPPLPGDVAAFAPHPNHASDSQPDAPGWRDTDPNAQPLTQAEAEALEAQRSTLFFALRQEPQQARSDNDQSTSMAHRSPLTAIAAQQLAAPEATPADRSLFPGAEISASLVTEINSEAPGPVIAQVTQAIYDSATGRNLLIPQGARLIGDYASSTRYGQSRVVIAWSRLIMPDGEEIALKETATDPAGAVGVRGKVDNHWGDVFGAALLGTIINIGVATTEEPQLSYTGLGATARDPIDAALADGVQRGASIVTNRVVDRSLAIPPTIKVVAGTRVGVIVTRRMQF